MAVGTTQYLNNAWLNTIKSTGASFNVAAGIFAQLHTANPGAAGATAVSSVTVRQAATFASATTGVLASSNTPSWTAWAGTNGEIVSHVSFWDIVTAASGNCLWTAALSVSKTINTGDTFTLSSSSLTITNAS
jgi:uncharacterized cupin superfamily protein